MLPSHTRSKHHHFANVKILHTKSVPSGRAHQTHHLHQSRRQTPPRDHHAARRRTTAPVIETLILSLKQSSIVIIHSQI